MAVMSPAEATRSETHGRERYRLVRLAITAGGAERVATTLASGVRVPLLAWALGARGYGLYVATLGIVAAANLLDFGLQYGIVNAVANARGRDDEVSIREIVATAALIYATVSVVAVVALGVGIGFVRVDDLFHTDPGESTIVKI